MLILAAAFSVMSCDESDDDDNPNSSSTYQGVEYTGTTTVSMTMYGQTASYDSENTVVYIDKGSDSVTATFAQICFTENIPQVTTQMPSLDIVLTDIPTDDTADTYYTDSITATMLDGEPYGNDIIKSIDNLSVDLINGEVTISFNCTVEIDMGSGANEYTFSVFFTTIELDDEEDEEGEDLLLGVPYYGTITTYSSDSTGNLTQLYTADEVQFFVDIDDNDIAALYATCVKFTPSTMAPELIMIAKNIAANSVGYDYEATGLTVPVYAYYNYAADATFDFVGFDISTTTLSVYISLTYNDASYVITFKPTV